MAFLPLLITLNLVGYNTKAAEANLNYYAPQFTSVGGNTVDIQDISLTDEMGMVGYGDIMQIAGPLGSPMANYAYWASYMDPTFTVTKDFYWANEDLTPANVSFDKADGIGIDNSNSMEYDIGNAGEVIVGDITIQASGNLNWLGNPFSANISIQDIELKDEAGMVGYGDIMQLAGPLGSPMANYAYWASYMDPTFTVTKDFYWANEDLTPADKTFAPGEGFAIDNSNSMEYDIVIKCPYSLYPFQVHRKV